ncbi:hypothetical protein Nmel_012273 [Mimus melanotis]
MELHCSRGLCEAAVVVPDLTEPRGQSLHRAVWRHQLTLALHQE